MSSDRIIIDAIKMAQRLLWQNLAPTHQLPDATTVMRFRDLVLLPPYNLRWSAAATRFPHSRCERWSVCLRIDRGPIVRSSVGSGTYLMTLISTKPWDSHRIPASRSDHIQRDVDASIYRCHRGDARGPSDRRARSSLRGRSRRERAREFRSLRGTLAITARY